MDYLNLITRLLKNLVLQQKLISSIILLSKTVSPAFLRADLNEVENNNCNKPFIEGFWKRLHPEGNHPGLSDEEDSTFRYHISIVVALNLLNRLTKRN